MFERLRQFLSSPISNRRTIVASAVASTEGHLANPAEVLGNPLRNLTPANAADLLSAAMRGEWTRIQWLMYYVEQWDADVWTLVERRCAGLRQLDWTIRTDSKADAAEAKMAERQAEVLRNRYNRILNMREAVEFLALAKFRGFSHLAIGEDRLEPIDQWWWLRDGMYGDWHYNPEARATAASAAGKPIDPAQFVIREEPRSLIWLSILKFLRASYNAKWWDQFCEIASRQGTVIVGPDGLTDEQASEFAQKAAAIARGGSGVLEFGSTVLRPAADGKGTGQTAWESRLRYLKEDLILAGTGGMLTAISQATGIGGSQGEEQGNVWRSLLRADAGDISEVLQEQIDQPLLAREFPNQPVLAWFELDAAEQPSTDTVLDHAVKAHQAGLAIDPDQIAERTGYTFVRSPGTPSPSSALPPGTPSPSSALPPGTPSPSSARLLNRAAEQLAIPEAWLAPASDLFAEIEKMAQAEQMDGTSLANRLDDLAARVPELFGRMDHDALAALLESAMTDAATEAIGQTYGEKAR